MIKNNINKFKNKKYFFVLFLFCFVFIFFKANLVLAAPSVGGTVSTLLGYIALFLAAVVGFFLTFLIKILINVANFSNIIDVPTVRDGWMIIRDLCNMSFVLILLVIAFATILKQENYSVKKLLPKILIMAVLINFSKTIFGLIIDFSQVIMLTFINGLGGDNAASFLIDAFQVKEMSSVNNTVDITVNGWNTAVASVLGLIAIMIAFVVVAVILAVLIMRIIMLWVYTIFSPLVFLGFAFAPIQKYIGKIWEDFIKQVIVGPVLAFFLWLALATASKSADEISELKNIQDNEMTAGLNSLFSEGNFQQFIIVIGMLVGGLIITQQIGGIAGSIAGKGMATIQKGGGLALSGAKRMSFYDAVADRSKAYLSMRKSARDDRIKASTIGIAGKIGRAKKFVGEGISRNTWELFSGGRKAKTIKESIEQGKDFEDNNVKYKYNKTTRKWSNGTQGSSISNDDMSNNFKNRISELQAKQKTVDNWGKGVLAVAGAGLGFVTGGIAGAAVGAAVGGGAVPNVGKDIREAGKIDLNIASNFWSEQVNKAKDNYKYEEGSKILSAMDDKTLSIFQRVAAAMEAMEKGIMPDANKAIEIRQTIIDEMNGDKKTLSKYDAIAEDKYISASSAFRDHSEENIGKRKEKAENGIYTLDNLNKEAISFGSIEIVDGMGLADFSKQFNALKVKDKKDHIKDVLEKIVKDPNRDPNRADVKDKASGLLALNTGDFKNAYNNKVSTGTGSEVIALRKFLGSLKLSQINEINEKSAESSEDFKRILANSGQFFNDNVKSQMRNNSNLVASNLRDALKIALNTLT